MGHGGARPGTGPKLGPDGKALKPYKRRDQTKVSSESSRTPAHDAQVVSTTPPAAPRRPIMSDASVMAILESFREHSRKRSRSRTEETNPYIIRPDRLGYGAQHVQKHNRKIAMDDNSALMASNQFAVNAWQSAIGPNDATDGMLFLGYPYLSELLQRAEFRLFGEIMSEEMTRKWISFRGTDDESTKEAEEPKDRNKDDDEVDENRKKTGEGARTDARNKEIERKIIELRQFAEELKLQQVFKTVAAQDESFGISHLYLDLKSADIENLRDPENAMSIGNGRDAISKAKLGAGCLKGLRTIEPIWCYPMAYNASNPLSPSWYDPAVWYVMGAEVHKTRLIPFIGRPVPDILKPAYAFGGLSMSQMAQPYVDIWLRTRESVAEIIHAFSVMVLQTNMATTTQPGGAGGGNGDVIARMMLANMLRDNQGMMVIDKATEDFKNISAPLGGLDDLQAQSQEHMFAVSRIPGVKFAGLQPKGLNASSDGEMRAFNDTVHGKQEHLFRGVGAGSNGLTTVVDIMQIHLWGERDPDITYDFNPLHEETVKEKGEVRKLEAETDQIRIDSGVVSQEEVRAKVVADPESGFHGLDPDDVPDLLGEEEEGLIPPDAGKGLEAELEEGGGGAGKGTPEARKPGKQPSKGGAGDEAPGLAAGIVHRAPDGTVLLVRRSQSEGNYKGHWALPGGKADAGESPEEAARRENEEEIGADKIGDLRHIDEITTPTGMKFHTFLHDTEKFNPELNDEHDGFVWADRSRLPEPMHPAVKAVLGRIDAEDGGIQNFDGAFDEWSESKHPRGQPGNAGQFGSGGGSGGSSQIDAKPSEALQAAISKAKVPEVLRSAGSAVETFNAADKKLNAIARHIMGIEERLESISSFDRPESLSELSDMSTEEEGGDLDYIIEVSKNLAKSKFDPADVKFDQSDLEVSTEEKHEAEMLAERLRKLYPVAKVRARDVAANALDLKKSLGKFEKRIDVLTERLDEDDTAEAWILAATALSAATDAKNIPGYLDFLSGGPGTEEVRSQIQDLVDEENERVRWESLSHEEQEGEIERKKKDEQEEDRQKTEEINAEVDKALSEGWIPKFSPGGSISFSGNPESITKFASPKSVQKVLDRIEAHFTGKVV